ncbi:putative target of rapamycin (TOR) kinase 1 [Trypanosoma cruzi]|nr:putative target of rapamycin (TOR) kinase 1 [Trypanosoma cruzi]
MRHSDAQFFNHRGNGGYGVTLFVRGCHFWSGVYVPSTFSSRQCDGDGWQLTGDCAGDIPGEPSAGSGWFGRGIATHHREYNRKRIIKSTKRHRPPSSRTHRSMDGSRFYSPDFGDVKIAGGKWKRKPFLIMQAEARAVRLALSAFSTILPSTTDVWVDNTSPLLAANKGSSKSHALTWELQRIYVFF